MKQQEMDAFIKESIAQHLDMDKTLVFVFGSRADGTAAPASDYDIGIFAGRPISWKQLGSIRADLEESDLPVTVDLVDFSGVSRNFKRIALRKVKVWNLPKQKSKLKSLFLPGH